MVAFKSPINTGQQLMAVTAEECGELTQACMKLIRKHEDVADMIQDEKFRSKLVEEAGDVLCMLELMAYHGLYEMDEIIYRAQVKRDKLKFWSTLIK